jgi:hypothetical protein
MWPERLIFHLCPKLNFLFKRQFSQDILQGLVEKTNELYVFRTLAECYSTIASFDLQMSKGANDVCTLVIKILNNDW